MSAALDVRAGTPGWDDVVAGGLTTARAFPSRAAEHDALRAVAALDLGLARILDGHRNALERVLSHRPQDVPAEVRATASEGLVAHGVWGADPRGDEGPPARLDVGGRTVSGVKTFCSGAGLVERALVLVRPPAGGAPVHCVLLDVSDPTSTAIDESWFAGPALRSSASHRVVLDGAPVLATLGGPGVLLEEPWFSGDALRTAVTWAGAVDAVLDGTTAALRGRPVSDAEAALLGRAHASGATIDRWIAHATTVRDLEPTESRRTVLLARLEITERAREVLRTAAELTGSHPGAVGDRVARARGDLDLLLLQHRLTPAAVRLGHELVGADA